MGKRCLQSRPRGPSAKRQPSPEGLGIQRQPVERRRCGTTLFVCSLRDPVTFSIFSCFLHPTRCCLVPSTKASSCLPRRAVGAKRLADLLHIRGFMARSRRTRRCLLAGALPNFPATNYREIKNVTSSDRGKRSGPVTVCHGGISVSSSRSHNLLCPNIKPSKVGWPLGPGMGWAAPAPCLSAWLPHSHRRSGWPQNSRFSTDHPGYCKPGYSETAR